MTQFYTFSPVTATDRAGLVWVASILSLLFSVLTLATRFQVKFHTLGRDDWAILAGTVLSIGQYTAIYVGLSNGVGTSSKLLSQTKAKQLGQSVMTSEVMFIAALTLSKLSIVLFMKRLFTRDHRRAWWACNAALVLTVVWGVASALAVTVSCGPSNILQDVDKCAGELDRWAVVIGTDAALEVFYVALSVVLVQPLQMSASIKVTVVCAFAFRLICAIFAAMHGMFVARYVRSADPGLAIANVLVWQQVELGYALISATIPTLKSFVRGYNKAMGWESYEKTRRIGGGYNLGSYGMSGNRSTPGTKQRSNNRSRNDNEASDTIELRPADAGYRAGAYHEPSRQRSRRMSDGAASGDSEDPIIRRDVSVTVGYENAVQHR